MKRKPKTLPKLWQRKRGGKFFGCHHIYIANKPVNLCTDDVELANVRRREAVHNGTRRWSRHMLPKNSAPASVEGAAAMQLAALGETDAPFAGSNPVAEATPAAGAAPFPLPPPEMGPEVIEPEPIAPPPPAGDWAADLGAASSGNTGSSTPPPPGMKFADVVKQVPWLDAALVTASKACVGLQMHAQAWTMRLVGDVEAGRVGPPPKVQEPDGPETMSAFMKAAGARWDADDPREPGRNAYEETIVALVPDDLAIPAWMAWLKAPALTLINTAPIQWQTGRKIKRDAAGEEVPPPDSVEEAPADARAAA